jgi:hypothetical protein
MGNQKPQAKNKKGQTMMNKTLHRKQKFEQHESHFAKPGLAGVVFFENLV